MQGNVRNLSARIDNVEVVEQVRDHGDMLSNGMDMLKSRFSVFGQGQHAEYRIIVNCDGKMLTCKKRFSEFAALHEFLRERFPNGLTFDLPSKTPVRMFSPEALEDRKNSLNAYLKELCRYSELINCHQVLAFFGVIGGEPLIHGASSYSGGHGFPGSEPRGSGCGEPRGQGHSFGNNFGDTRGADRSYDFRGPQSDAQRGSYSGSGGGYGGNASQPWPAPAAAPARIQGAPPDRPQIRKDDSDDDLAGWDR